MTATRLAAIVLAAAVAGAGGVGGRPTTAPAQRRTPAQRLAHEHERIALAKVPLSKVLDRYSAMSGLKVRAEWEHLVAAGVTRETPVTLKAYGITFEKLLDLTLDSIARRGRPLAWYLSGEVVHVSTQMRVLRRGRSVFARPVESARRPGRSRPPGTISFDQTPLHMVMDFLRDLSGLNIHVNYRSLEVIGTTRDTPVTLKARGLSLRRVLDLVVGQLGAGRDRYASVYWIVDEGVVHVGTGDSFNQRLHTRIYDVSDLLMVVPNFEGPRSNLMTATNDQAGQDTDANEPVLFPPAGGQPPAGGGTNDGDTRKEMEEKLMDIIRMAIGEEMWKPTGKGSVRIFRGKMIISQTRLGFKLLEQSLGR